MTIVARDAEGAEAELGQLTFTAEAPRIEGLTDGTIELGGDFEGGALVPPAVADELLKRYFEAFPWPRVIEATVDKSHEPWPLVDANAVCGMLFEWGRERAELQAEIALLRGDREPFRVLMDRALDAGLNHSDPLRRTVDADVLDLAERLGFKRPAIELAEDLAEVMERRGTVKMHGWRCHIVEATSNIDRPMEHLADGTAIEFIGGLESFSARITLRGRR